MIGILLAPFYRTVPRDAPLACGSIAALVPFSLSDEGKKEKMASGDARRTPKLQATRVRAVTSSWTTFLTRIAAAQKLNRGYLCQPMLSQPPPKRQRYLELYLDSPPAVGSVFLERLAVGRTADGRLPASHEKADRTECRQKQENDKMMKKKWINQEIFLTLLMRDDPIAGTDD